MHMKSAESLCISHDLDYVRTFTWDKKVEMLVKTTYSGMIFVVESRMLLFMPLFYIQSSKAARVAIVRFVLLLKAY